MKPTLRVRHLLLGAALVLGLAAAPPLAGGSGGLAGGNSVDRGDNPVVGSLPCLVDPRLLDIFWVPLGRPKPSASILLGIQPTLGLLGPTEFTGVLVDAYGSGVGFIDRRSGWSVLGLQSFAQVTFDRAAVAAGAIDLWQYVPVGYLGGSVSEVSFLGAVDRPILSQDVQLPLVTYAAHPNQAGLVHYTISPPSGSPLPVVHAEVELLGFLIAVRCQP